MSGRFEILCIEGLTQFSAYTLEFLHQEENSIFLCFFSCFEKSHEDLFLISFSLFFSFFFLSYCTMVRKKCRSKAFFILGKTFLMNYLPKINNRSSRKRCEICWKLTINAPERRHNVVLVFLLLTLNIFHSFFYSVSLFAFE